MDQTSHSLPLFKDPTLPPFEGDDLKRLAQEITKARSFLWQAQSFRYALHAAFPACHLATAHGNPGPPLEGPHPLWYPCSKGSCPASPSQPRNLGTRETIFLHLVPTRSQLQKKNDGEPKVTLS